jgi:Tol biopolymer transport system component
MGEVYRARDTKLGRDVALKVLPESFASDPDRVMRFEREAKTLASLNHPQIAQIYGLEQSPPTGSGQGAVSALVMELVEGEDLAQRIARGPIPIDEALPLARQMAEALETAHEAGIIHRDLKPANIKVRLDGSVKVLDFGLAKAVAPVEARAQIPGVAPGFSPANSPTITSPAMTAAGLILGTAAYMSPEQAKGKALDRRADIWAFGCVLYEMLTARRAFEGEDVTDTIAAVVTRDPDWSRLPASTPPAVHALLRRCLEKNISKRLPHVGVARLELDASPAVLAAEALPIRTARGGRMWMFAAVPIALAIGITAGVWGASRLRPTASAPTYRASLIFPRGGSLTQLAPTGRFAISPDGTQLVYAGTEDGVNRLWLRSLNELTARPIAELRGGGAGAPFWSPDSKRIAYFSDGQLLKVDATGGTPTVIAENPGLRQQPQPGTWNSDDVIVVSRAGTLAKVSANGGTLEPLTTLDTAAGENFHTFPHFLPDGQHLLYTAYKAISPIAVYATTLDRPSERQKVMDGGSNVQYVDNALLYLRGNSLVAQPFDVSRRALTGEPTTIVDSLLVNIAIHFGGAFSASAGGALVHQGVGSGQGLDSPNASTTLVWRTPAGAQQTLIDEPGTYRFVSIAPDGRNALVTKLDARGRSDLWTIDLARGVRTRVALTTQPTQLSGAVWLPDGQAFVVNLGRDQGLDLYRKPADATTAEELLLSDDRSKMPLSMSRDGRFLLFDTVSSATGGDIWVLPMDAPAKAAPFINTTFFERFAQFSPDGQWVAYVSDESGATEVYARAFPGGQTQVRVSSNGGDVPRWSRDGRQLFFYNNGKMMAATVKAAAGTLEVTAVTPLFDCRPPEGFRRMFYDVMPDGRFLMMAPAFDAMPTSLTLTINWPQRRRSAR